jgi:MoxR-like ATPase
VEGTIDLMPGDLVYHASIGPDGRPRLDPGPVLRHGEDLAVFFFNEINRARPQVHALLLRLMAERSVTAFNRDMDLPHLLVFADRNRMEREETFELPAAARDRFFMEVRVETPRDPEVRRALIFDTRFHDVDALVETVPEGILDFRALAGVGRAIQQGIFVSETLQAYVVAIWDALRDPQRAGLHIEGARRRQPARPQLSGAGRARACLARRARDGAAGRCARDLFRGDGASYFHRPHL